MRRGFLSQYFESIAVKRLTAVEVDTSTSHQHEFNGTRELKMVLREGTGEKVTFPVTFLWFGSGNEGISSEGFATWYDARLNHPTRSEYRLYFPTTDVSLRAAEGDYMFIARRTDGSLMIIIASSGSSIENQLFWLFGLEKPTGTLFEISVIGDKSDTELGFAARFILDELGIEIEEPEAGRLDTLLERFNGTLPSTFEFSAFARSTLQTDPLVDPDKALMAWMDQEEKLFRRMERQFIARRIEAGFIVEGDIDVEGFLYFSLQVQNRRKARAGFALENHLEQIFKAFNLHFARGKITENKSKPDFLFPGIMEYHNPDYPESHLTLLGAKTTCKDRWRQVVTEASRIKTKHLLTLEPGISLNQTREMQSQNLQLVIPDPLKSSYLPEQQDWLLTLNEFIQIVSEKQRGPSSG